MKRPSIYLILILAVYLLLSLAAGAINPLFEAPDEIWHYFTAQTIAETGELPRVDDPADEWMSQEAAQPPLYYLLVAGLIGSVDTSEARQQVWANPRVQLGDASSPTNINAFVHTAAEAWPWQGYSLAVHVARAFSAILGLGTLLAVYASGRLIWPSASERALLAAALVAFLPQFVFLHGSVSNDAMIIVMSSVTLYQLLAMWYQHVTWWRLLALGITIGLAILSKMAGLLLLAYAAGFLTLLIWRDQRRAGKKFDFGIWLRWLGLVVVVALLIGGWLLVRNWQLYGDFTATNQILQFFGGPRDYTLGQVLMESSGLWTSVFAIFGWFNVRPPDWVYVIWNGIVLASILGILLQLIRRLIDERARREMVTKGREWLARPAGWIDSPGFPAALLAIWVVLVYGALIRWMVQIHAAQGRLLFPALLPLALGLAYGLSRYRWKGVYLIAPTLALLTTVYSVAIVIPEAYARPSIITAREIPPTADMYDAELGSGLRLLAGEIQTDVAEPGEWIHLTLYWQADQVPQGAADNEAPEVVVELFGQDDELAGKLQSYHGGGLYPASLWPAGQIVADPLAVKIDRDANVPSAAQIFVRLSDAQNAVHLGTVKIEPAEWPPTSDLVLARLEGLELTQGEVSPEFAGPGETVTVELRWQVVSPPGRDLTTFVHLGDPSQPPLAQGDSPPLGGNYPTGLWASGEVIEDHYTLTVPVDIDPGRYPIHVGLYDPQSGSRTRLEVAGQRQPNDAYLVGWLNVEG